MDRKIIFDEIINGFLEKFTTEKFLLFEQPVHIHTKIGKVVPKGLQSKFTVPVNIRFANLRKSSVR